MFILFKLSPARIFKIRAFIKSLTPNPSGIPRRMELQTYNNKERLRYRRRSLYN